MKRSLTRTLSAALVCAFLFCSFTVSSSAIEYYGRLTHMLANPGFEDDRTGWTWTSQGAANFLIHDDDNPDSIFKEKISHSGHKSAILAGAHISFYQEITLPQVTKFPGFAFIFGVYAKNFLVNRTNTVVLKATDAATGLLLNKSEPVELTNEYQLLTLSFLPEYEITATRTIRLELLVEGNALVDDFGLDYNDEVYPTLKNDGFENGLSGWTESGSGNTYAFTTDAQAHSGKNSLWISCFSGGSPLDFPIQQTITGNQGHYTLFAWIKADGSSTDNGAVTIRLNVVDKNGDVLKTMPYIPLIKNTGGEWQRIRMELEAPYGVDHIDVQVMTINYVGSIYVDDVKLFYYDSTISQ